MIGFNQYILLIEEENKKDDNPDNWHTFHSLNGKKGTWRVNYKNGSYKKYAKENGFIDKVREKDKIYHRKHREELKKLYKSGIHKNKEDRTKKEKKAIDSINYARKSVLNAQRLNSDFREKVKGEIAYNVIKNFSNSNALKEGINVSDIIQGANKQIPLGFLTTARLEILQNLPDDENEYTNEQKDLIKLLKAKHDDLLGIFDGLKQLDLLSDEDEKHSINKIYDETKIGNIFKDLFVNKSSEKKKETNKKIISDQKPFEEVETNLKRYFNRATLKKLSKPFLRKLDTAMEKLPENIKELYLKYGKKIEIEDADLNSCEAYYDNNYNTISFNQYNIITNPLASFFHESGHAIDNNINHKPFRKNYFSYNSKAGERFIKAIHSETQKLLEKRKNDFLKLPLKRYLKKYNISESSYVVDLITKVLEKNNNDKSSIDENDLHEILHDLYNEELTQHEYQVNGILKDITSLSTGGDFYLSGHDKEYCERGNIDGKSHGYNDITTTETFAEITELYCSNIESIEIFKKYYPKTLKAYDNLVNRALQK